MPKQYMSLRRAVKAAKTVQQRVKVSCSNKRQKKGLALRLHLNGGQQATRRDKQLVLTLKDKTSSSLRHFIVLSPVKGHQCKQAVAPFIEQPATPLHSCNK